jgi:hypothetical protein
VELLSQVVPYGTRLEIEGHRVAVGNYIKSIDCYSTSDGPAARWVIEETYEQQREKPLTKAQQAELLWLAERPRCATHVDFWNVYPAKHFEALEVRGLVTIKRAAVGHAGGLSMKWVSLTRKGRWEVLKLKHVRERR